VVKKNVFGSNFFAVVYEISRFEVAIKEPVSQLSY